MRGGREEEEERGTEEERGGTYPEMLKNKEEAGRCPSLSPPHPAGPRHQAATQWLSVRMCHSLPGEGTGLPRPVETRIGSRAGTERACRVRNGFPGSVGSATLGVPGVETASMPQKSPQRRRL